MSIAIHRRRPWPGQPGRNARPDQVTSARDLADQVFQRTGLSNRDEAEGITRMTLRCLLARLSRPLQQRLLHELPAGLGRYLKQHPAPGNRFEPPERYFEQIALEVELEPEVARRQAVSVGATLAESLPEAVLSDIAGEVPRIFQALFPQRAGLLDLSPPSRLASDAVIPLFMAPTTTPSYLGLAWHCSSQKL